MTGRPQDPLPGELLPPSSIDDDPAAWEDRLQSLLVAAEPVLAQYRSKPVSWLSLLADRLRPSLAFAAAAAAAAAIAVHISLPAQADRPALSLPLATIVSEGNAAAALWPIITEEVDPVLALVLLEDDTP